MHYWVRKDLSVPYILSVVAAIVSGLVASFDYHCTPAIREAWTHERFVELVLSGRVLDVELGKYIQNPRTEVKSIPSWDDGRRGE